MKCTCDMLSRLPMVAKYTGTHVCLIIRRTRRSENDNTPQPLDQGTNSPYIGQQVGNCRVHIDPLLG